MNFRVGLGYDVHKLVSDRPLILGGVTVPFELGLLGHSDADVLTHAVMDALLGAIGLGDIGRHFPDSDEKYKGISSLTLLKAVKDKLDERCCKISNIDTVIISERPKLNPYAGEMQKNIAGVLGIAPEQVNIKATTEEGLGFTGDMSGIAAKAIALVYIDNFIKED
jgi:2-C-methyl-D-erythritol 2,4-cyclodiphosphate synthase